MQLRRKFLIRTTSLVAAARAAIATWPFLASVRPSTRARSVAEPVQVDLRKLESGQQVTVAWQGKPIWVLRRSQEMLETLVSDTLLDRLADPDSRVTTQQPAYARNLVRSIKPEIFVTTAICTHLGCVPLFRTEVGTHDTEPEWPGGYYCPCHKSNFDFGGRVFKAVPAPTSLVIPPRQYIDDDTVEIGVSDDFA